VVLERGRIVFDEGESPHSIYVVVCGEVVLYKVDASWRASSRAERAAAAEARDPAAVFGANRELMQRARFGSMIGELNYTLQQPRLFAAVTERDAVMFQLTRERLQDVEAREPHLAVGLFKVIGRSLAMTLVNLQSLSEQFDA